MKKTFLILSIFLSAIVQAQEKVTPVTFKGRGYFESVTDLGDGGIIFVEGMSKVVNKHPGALHYFSAKGDLIWKKPISNNPGKTFVVASSDGSIIYHVDTGGPISILQIKSDGSTKEKDLPESKAFAKNLISMFCDKSYLYFLSSMNGDHFNDKKRGTDKLIVHRYSNADFSYKKLTLALPAIASNDNTSFWAFAGQNEDMKYVLSKEVDERAGSMKITITGFTPEGVTGEPVTITSNLPTDQKFSKPMNYTAIRGATILQDMDNQMTGVTRTGGLPHDFTGGSTVAGYATTKGMYVSTYYEPSKKEFYLIVITESKEKKPGFSYTMSKYNSTGQELWKNTLGNLGSSIFTFNVLPGGTVNLTTYGETGIVSQEIQTDGKPGVVQNIEYGANMEHTIDSNWKWRLIATTENGKPLRSSQFINNLPLDDKKSGTFGNFVSSQGELVLHAPKKGDTRLLYFAKK
jgi:hypothetical protein